MIKHRKPPSDEFQIVALQQMETHSGVAFTATVARNGVAIGTLEDEGRGGPVTWHCSVIVPETESEDGTKDWDFSLNRATTKAFMDWVSEWPITEYAREEYAERAAGGEDWGDLLKEMDDGTWEPFEPLGWVAEWMLQNYELAEEAA